MDTTSINSSDSIRKYFVKLSLSERFGYAFGGLGLDIVFQAAAMFLMYFYTDVFGITVSQVTLLFLVSRVWDAFFDPIMGTICEKSNPKHGKYRSWILYCVVPYGISVVLCFTTPNFSAASKLAFAWVSYIAFGMLFAGVIIPFTSLSSSLTQDPQERTVLNSTRMFFSQLGGVAASLLVPYFSTRLGKTLVEGYQRAMIILAVISVIAFLITYFTTKERVPNTPEPFKVSDILVQVKKNKPLMMLFGLYIGIYTFFTIFSGVGTYYITYYVNRPDLLAQFSLLNTFPSIIPLLFVPLMVKHWGKKKVVYIACGISAIASLVMFIIPATAIDLIFTAKGIAAFGYGIQMGIIWSIVPDTVEYGQYVTGKRSGAIIYAIPSFAVKAGMAIGGIIPSIVLGIVGYVPNVTQTSTSLMGILALTSIVPALFLVIGLLIFRYYDLDEKRFEEIVELIQQRDCNIMTQE